MDFLDVMQTYFRGEKVEAWFFIFPTGLILITLGIVALKAERGGFAWGIAIPCFLFGAVLVGTGITVGGRTAGQVAEIARGYQEEPAVMVQKEIPRMEKVRSTFRTTFYAFGGTALIALILLYAVNAGWARGVATALILGAGIGLFVDGFAERRTEPYAAALEQLAEQHGVSQLAEERPDS